MSVSNFEYCHVLPQKADKELMPNRGVCLDGTNKIDYPQNAADLNKVIGVTNGRTLEGKVVPVMTFPGQRVVVELNASTAAFSAGDYLKVNTSGRFQKVAGGDAEHLKVAILIGPEKEATANAEGRYAAVQWR